VYTWGKAKDGGHGELKNNQDNFEPKLVKFFGKNNLKVEKVYAGSRHSLALTTCNKVYSWGKGDYGQLGNGMINDCLEPTRVMFPMSPSVLKY